MTNKLVLAYTYYNAPLMLREQIRYWQTYTEAQVHNVKVILIDDGSIPYPAEKEIKQVNLRLPVELYRITKDIPQNTFGARNLAFHIASVENLPWVLSLDIDHVLPSSSLAGFEDLKNGLMSSFYYLPARYRKTLEGMVPISRHSDTYLISPSLFWKTGGYDEDLTGYYYNGAAHHFRIALTRLTRGVEVNKLYTVFYSSALVEDASPLEGGVKKTFAGRVSKDKEPSVLNFEWERVL